MTKVYIVVDACSGEDYSNDDPTILFVSSKYKEAKDFFNDEISNWEDGLEDFDSNCENIQAKLNLFMNALTLKMIRIEL